MIPNGKLLCKSIQAGRPTAKNPDVRVAVETNNTIGPIFSFSHKYNARQKWPFWEPESKTQEKQNKLRRKMLWQTFSVKAIVIVSD